MIVISYSMSLRALDDYVKKHNSHHQQLSQQIRQSVCATAKELIRLHGRLLSKIKSEVLDINQLPPLRTNNVYLSKVVHTSTRTIQRHLKRLMDTGIITRKKFRGSRANYELWINPKLLFIDPLDSVEKPSKVGLDLIIENQLFTKENMSICPDRDSGNSNNIIKNLSKCEKECQGQRGFKKLDETCCEILSGYTGEKVRENVDDRQVTGNNCCEILTGYTGEKVRENVDDRQVTGNNCCEILSGYTGEKVEEEIEELEELEGAGEKVRMRINRQEEKKDSISNFDEVRSASLSLYSSMMWTRAKKVLYADVFLSKRQCEIGLKLIRKWYEPIATERLAMVHQVYLSRIGLVRKFLDKDRKNRFVQLPYLYFDLNNSSGFRGTKKWWLKQQERNVEIGEKLILHHQIQKLSKNKSRDGNQSCPPLKLYLECEEKIRQLENPQLLQDFYSRISSQGIS